MPVHKSTPMLLALSREHSRDSIGICQMNKPVARSLLLPGHPSCLLFYVLHLCWGAGIWEMGPDDTRGLCLETPRQPFHESGLSSPGYQKPPDIKPASSVPPPFPSLPSKGARATDSPHLPLAALHSSLTASGKTSLCVRGLHTPATSQRMRYGAIRDNGSAGNVVSHSSPFRLFATRGL